MFMFFFRFKVIHNTPNIHSHPSILQTKKVKKQTFLSSKKKERTTFLFAQSSNEIPCEGFEGEMLLF